MFYVYYRYLIAEVIYALIKSAENFLVPDITGAALSAADKTEQISRQRSAPTNR